MTGGNYVNSKLSAFAGKLAFLAVIAGCGYLGYRMLTVPREEPAQAEELARPVRTMTLSAAGAMTKHHYFGTVQGSQRVNLSFRVSGPLVELPFDMGNSVKKGDLIGKIDPRDFITRLNDAQSVLSQARAKHAEAQNNFRRYEELYKKKVIAQAQYDRYKTALDVARSNLKSAEAQVSAAQDSLADTELRAPFDGVIVERMVQNFQDVQAKQPIASLQNLKNVEIVFNVPDKDVVNVSVSSDPLTSPRLSDRIQLFISATFDAFPGRTFDVKFKEFGAQADARTQTYPVTVTMEQPENARILPGMPVNITVDTVKELAPEDQSFFVPASAVIGDQVHGSWIWKYVNGTVHKVPVELGAYRGDRIEIKGDLKPENVIVTAGMHYLKEGQKVRLTR